MSDDWSIERTFMTRNYREDAERFAETLRAGNPPAPALPAADEVSRARTEEFPLFGEGIAARSQALKDRFGEGYGLGFGLGSRDIDRSTGVATATLHIYNGDWEKPTKLPVVLAPGLVTFGNRSFTSAQEAEASAALDELLRPYFS
ncbi:hypothetical protein [Sphingomonas sp. OTU376]|uniref:hypothetical protein n=1 Tax=Sphingomonas sp. OTU376 TaxID=3043863 RepID=UPI00313F36FE